MDNFQTSLEHFMIIRDQFHLRQIASKLKLCHLVLALERTATDTGLVNSVILREDF